MHITLSNHLHLPADAVTQKQAFLGMSGSGLIDYPRPGFVVAKAVLFLDGGHA